MSRLETGPGHDTVALEKRASLDHRSSPLKYLCGPKEIKHQVNRFILARETLFRGKTVVDVPAGTGLASAALSQAGAEVLAFDLFPDFFRADGVVCSRCDLNEGIPLPPRTADYLICQEGLEHLPDQLRTLKEFNRVLKPGGTLLVTTPNYSNLKAKLSYLLTESEYVHKIMPPNEVDDLWFAGEDERAYLGHLFLTGIQRLRALARLAGFVIDRLHWTRAGGTSLALLCLLYPAICLTSWVTLRNGLRKKKRHPHFDEIESVYRELFRLNTDLRVLTCTHLFVEFRKTAGCDDVSFARFQKYGDAGFVT